MNTTTQQSLSDDTQIILGSFVRIVSLVDDDAGKNESAFFKYRLVNPQNISNRRLPDVLLIGVKKAGTRALLEFLRIHPNIRAAGRIDVISKYLKVYIQLINFVQAVKFTFSTDIIQPMD